MARPLRMWFPLAMSMSACSDIAFEDFFPTVRFDTMRVSELSFESIEADFVFQVDNPNPVQVDLAKYSYAFGLGGVDLLSGDNGEGFTLAASGASELVLPARVVFADAWEAVQATRGVDDIPFALSGGFGFDTPIGVVDIPYAADGAFPALRTPKITFEGVRFGTPDWFAMRVPLEVDLGIDNEHGSNLLFEQFDYGLSLSGRRVATGIVPALADIPGGTKGTSTIGIELNLLSAGEVVLDLLDGSAEPLQLGLDANLDVATPWGVLPLSVTEAGLVPNDKISFAP